jgi:hypothetical protein
MVIVRQPDGTAAFVPEWMMYPEAARLGLCEQPRLPLGCLRDLRHLLRAILRTPAVQGESEDGGSSRRNLNPTPQLGLFQALAPRIDLPEKIRADLLPLMRRLLQAVVQGENNAERELNHD